MVRKSTGKTSLPIGEKFLITVNEASEYFNIGVKNLRRLSENPDCDFAFRYGNKILFCRQKMEEYFVSKIGCAEDEPEEE